MSLHSLIAFRNSVVAALILAATSSVASAQPIVSELVGGAGSPGDLGILVGIVGATYAWAWRRRSVS